jgi:hypothetical protein
MIRHTDDVDEPRRITVNHEDHFETRHSPGREPSPAPHRTGTARLPQVTVCRCRTRWWITGLFKDRYELLVALRLSGNAAVKAAVGTALPSTELAPFGFPAEQDGQVGPLDVGAMLETCG